jgi:hypothetical protein
MRGDLQFSVRFDLLCHSPIQKTSDFLRNCMSDELVNYFLVLSPKGIFVLI